MLLIAGGTSVRFANGATSLVNTVTVPVTATALTLVYLRLADRPAIIPARREHDHL